MNIANHYEKVNTFSRSIEISQIITYCVILAQIIIFLAAIQTNYASIHYKIIMNFFVLTPFCILVLAAFKTSSIDPVDEVLVEYRNGEQQKVMTNLDSCLYCDICSSYVKSSSKHCRLCNRCVGNFDHHCKWINNCIGQNNYFWFLAMIISALTFKICICVSIGLLYDQQNYSLFMGSMIAGWVIMAITLPFCLLLLALVCFHLYLISIKMTTFEFIMRKQSLQDKKENKQQAHLNKTEENLVPYHQHQARPNIFQERVSEVSSKQKKSVQKIQESTNKKASKTQQTQNAETNEKQLKKFYKKSKSLKFLIGQSLLVDKYRVSNYNTINNGSRYNKSDFQRQRPFHSYKQELK